LIDEFHFFLYDLIFYDLIFYDLAAAGFWFCG